ncbi:hypothetical protein CCP3SC1_1060009 [Gammaproteobacteria bacterium]
MLYGVADQVSLYAKPAIMASRTVQATKPSNTETCTNVQGVVSPCNNYTASEETLPSRNAATLRDTLTHRIVDFDKIVRNQTDFTKQINQTWATTSYAVSNTRGDHGRIPLLVVHGWQGDKGLRSPAKLGQWANSELHYFQHFLDYYLATPALQQKYHVYLYHYPSYKHVTYNAKILTDLLRKVQANKPNSDLAKGFGQTGMVILAHSMGGLVSRSAIEEYASFGTAGERLKRLILLDTPHHGSVLAMPRLIGNSIKDLYSQGAASLQWDNFDGLRTSPQVNDDRNKRWNTSINSKNFDVAYDAQLTFLSPNPWLSWLNSNYRTNLQHNFLNKYVIYSAWMDPYPSIFDVLNNGLDFYISNDGPINSIASLANLPGGGAEQVTSSLWNDQLPQSSQPPFNPSVKRQAPFFYPNGGRIRPGWYVTDWFAPKNLLTSQNINYAKNILVSKTGTTHPHPYGFSYRIFWDYDHDKIKAGAYAGGGEGIWDQYIKKDVSDKDTTVDSAFYSTAMSGNRLARDLYIETAQAFQKDKEGLNFLGGVPEHYNPLKLEPVFMVLQRDLMDVAP